MAKEIKFNIEARDQLKKGIDALADDQKAGTLFWIRNSDLPKSQKMGLQ